MDIIQFMEEYGEDVLDEVIEILGDKNYDSCDDKQCDDESCVLRKSFVNYLKYK